MSAVYIESSAVLAWLFGERAASHVIQIMNSASTIVSSKLTVIEARRAVVRAIHQRVLSVADGRRLEGFLQHESLGWVLMEVDEHVADRSGRTFPAEPIRTLDAIHVATALEFLTAFPDLTVLSFDERIRNNCEALGMVMSDETPG